MKQAHQTFLIEMIKHGDKTMAYQKAYPNCTDSESARKSAERLLRNHPGIAAEIEEATANIRQRAYADAYKLHTEQYKTQLLSMMDKRMILARIAKCEIKVCRYIKDGDRYRMLFEDPHPREIIRAIEADGRIEDRCNRARNFTDPKLSQFYIYIDGRPCDDPTAPVNPDLPPGIVVLPRTRKNLNQEQGNNSEHLSHQGGENDALSPAGGGVRFADGGGVLAPEKSLIEEPGINLEPLSRQGGETTETALPLRLSDSAVQHSNTTQQISTRHTSPPPGDLGGQLTLENSPLYAQYLALYQKRKLQAEDLMSASFYEQEKQAEADAPPPHILTDEEVRQFHAEADRELEEKKKPRQQSYNTFGKMYFPPEGRNPSK